MSSELQLDVRHLNRWRRHLVNAYEVRQTWCLLQVKLCDPCLSSLKWSLPCKALYKCSALPLPLPFSSHWATELLSDRLPRYLRTTQCTYMYAYALWCIMYALCTAVEGEYRIVRSCATDGRPDRGCIARTGTRRVKLWYCECEGDGCNAATPSVTTLANSLLMLSTILIVLMS